MRARRAETPKWTFASTAIKPGPGTAFEVDGILTVHGVAQPVADGYTTHGLPHPLPRDGHLDRHAFGMRTTPQDGLIGSAAASRWTSACARDLGDLAQVAHPPLADRGDDRDEALAPAGQPVFHFGRHDGVVEAGDQPALG